MWQGGRFWRNSNIQTSYVRFNGFANGWGNKDVNGMLQGQTRTLVLNQTDVRQGSSASAIWTTNTTRPINALKSRENFTYTFYAARLVNASDFGLNVDGTNFALEGNWTIYKVTANVTIITNGNNETIKTHCDI